MNPVVTEVDDSADPACFLETHSTVPSCPSGQMLETTTVTFRSWWLWPHLLSLDAPLVAVVWQRWFAHIAGVRLPPSRDVILGFGVWLIYLADRLADTANGHRQHDDAARHIFSDRHRRVLFPLAILLAAVLVVLAPWMLPSGEFCLGLGILAFALSYFWLIHRWPGRRWAAVWPKEAAVGGMFAAGSAFFVICRSPHFSGTSWLITGLFAGTCFLNCALITKWERHGRDLRENSSLLNAFPQLSARLRFACFAVATGAMLISGATASWNAMPVAASALLLAWLDSRESHLSVETLRVLVDVVLLTPWFLLIFKHAGS